MTLTKSGIINNIYNQHLFFKLKTTQLFADHTQGKDLIKGLSI